MANIWIDKENGSITTPVSNGAKSLLGKNSGRIHTVKKQAFGELKNLMNNHNVQGYQHLKTNIRKPVFGKTNENLYTDVLKKQQMKSNLHNGLEKTDQLLKMKNENMVQRNPKSLGAIGRDDSGFFSLDEFDFPFKSCKSSCSAKGLQDSWSELNLPNDNFFDRIVNGLGNDPHFAEDEIEDDKLEIHSISRHDTSDFEFSFYDNDEKDDFSHPKIDMPLYDDDSFELDF